MRCLLATLALALGLSLGAPVQAHGLRPHGEQCSSGADYDVQVKTHGIAFDGGDEDAANTRTQTRRLPP